jgi:tetratricopeptide (TPR) repeat protein
VLSSITVATAAGTADGAAPTEGGPSSGAAAPAAPSGGVGAQEPGPTTRKQREEQAALTYDRIYVIGQAGAYFGILEAEGRDLFALEASTDFDGVTLRMRIYDVDKARLGEVRVFGNDVLKLQRVVLAGTMRNEIQRRDRAVQKTPAHLPELRGHIDWLLATARTDARVYDEAQKQAELYRDLAGKDIDGQRMLQTVLRARGDLAGETAMLMALPETGREGAFRHEALGQIKARLGLDAEAEADLRTAVSLTPADARPHAALADQHLGSVPNPADQARLRRLIAQALLAGGDLDGARQQLAAMPREHAAPLVEGALAYAAGRTADALAAFRAAATTGDSGAALLGQAACLLRDSQWQAAHDLLVDVADREPLLRHRAMTGLSLLWQRLGQNDAALAAVDRALEADPNDPYAHYLRGRVLRLMGQPTAADELRSALRKRDDFVHAIAEMSAVQAAVAEGARGTEQAEAAVAARRYADRAVALVPQPSVELFERQGVQAFVAADPEAAANAFQQARTLAADEAGQSFAKGALAVVDYSRGRVEDAATALQRLAQDLGKESVIGRWADTTLQAIFDHAEKESLGDSFDRAEIGDVWKTDVDNSAKIDVQDGRLRFHEKLGKDRVSAERENAVNKGRNFLAAAVTMQLGKKHGRNDPEAFTGLALEVQRGAGATDFQAKLGVFEGKPHLGIQDGREAGADVLVRVPLPIPNPDLDQPIALELRVVPRGEGDGKQWALQASWNGNVVHRHELKSLSGNTTNSLKTILLATGQKGRTELDVTFDDYRLERRKETR